MTTSIVTGAAGFIGSHLTERLLKLGHDVIGIDCFTDYYERSHKEQNLAAALGNSRFRLIDGDLLSVELAPLLASSDYVFHLAAQAGVRGSWGERFETYLRNNLAATQRLLEATKGSSIKRLVYASSSSIYGDAPALPVAEAELPRPISPYGVTKLAAEHLCTLYARVYGVPAVALRLFTVYGPRQRPDMAIARFLTGCLTKQPITVLGDGTQTRDFTFVDDVVSAHVLALEAPTEDAVYNVCGGTRVTLNELLEQIERTTGRSLRVERQAAAPGDVRHTLGDNTRARQALGFRPETPLAEGLRLQWGWLQEHVTSIS